MNKIKNNYISEVTSFLYNPDGELLFTINSNLKLNDVRIQIKEQKLEGYYLKYKKDEGDLYKISINPNGQLSSWPEGFYDLFDKQLDKLLDLN